MAGGWGLEVGVIFLLRLGWQTAFRASLASFFLHCGDIYPACIIDQAFLNTGQCK